MTVYKLSDDGLDRLEAATFQQVGVLERQGLQPLLRENLDVILPGAMVLTEEFGDWEDSRRRIDLLALDSDARLVVIELKRTQDGGHMELQALRYAAMVSEMTFEQAVSTHAAYLERAGRDGDARQDILTFLDWEEEQEDDFAQDVRIVLASADFSKELTTSVLWLNDRGLDITCVRLQPYRDGDTVLLDVQQVVPLPEASEYTVRVRDKQIRERQARIQKRDLTRFDVTVDGKRYENLPKRRAIYEVVRALTERGVTPAQVKEAIPWRAKSLFMEVNGEVDEDTFRAEAAKAGNGTFHPRRWYCGDEDLFRVDGVTYALSKRWGNKTQDAMRELVQRYGGGVVQFAESGQPP